jgi:hypothetical protein
MNKFLAVLLASAVLSAGALAQTSVNSQTDASASENASVSADRSGVNAQSDTSAQASQQTTRSHPEKDQHPSKQPPKNNPQPSASTNTALAEGSVIQASLTKPVDTKRCKEGDQVFAKTISDVKSDGKVVIPKGTKLVGHVTQAQMSTKDNEESRLGIMFDRAMTKDGQEIPMHTVIQAVSSNQMTASEMNDAMMTQTGEMQGMTSTGGGLLRGVSSGVGATTGTVTNATANLGGTVNSATSATSSVSGRLTPTSTGIVGMPGLSMTSDLTNTTQGTLFTCKNQSIRLASGTEMMLKVVGQ